MKAKTLKRVLGEVKAVNADFFNLRTVISEDAVENDLTNFYFVMLPNDGAMAHLSLVGAVGIPETYPEDPPIVKLYTPTQRYNVDAYRHALPGGQRSSMCFDILRSGSDGGSWKPEYTLSSLFASLMSAIVSFYVYQGNGTERPEFVSMERLASVKESAEQVLLQHKSRLPKQIPKIPLVKATRVPALPLFSPQTLVAGSPGVLTSEPIFLQTNSDTIYTFAVDLSSLYDDIVFSVVLSNSKTDFLGRKSDTVLVRNGVTATAARKLAGKPIQWFYHGKPMNDGDMRLHVSVGRDQMTFAYYQDGELYVHGDCPVSRLSRECLGDVGGVPFFVHVVTKDKSVGKVGGEKPVEIEVLDSEGWGFVHEGVGGEEEDFVVVRKEDAVAEDGVVGARYNGLIEGLQGMQLK